MAEQSLCSIPDCGKRVLNKSRGLCSAHYQRLWKYGDALEIKCRRHEAQTFYEDVVLQYEGDDCLIWPYAKSSNGYGSIQRNLKRGNVSRFVCEDANGPPPTPEHEAAHSCGNGHLGCVTKGHLSWKTPIENNADKRLHGTHFRGEQSHSSKLTDNEAREIRSLKGKETLASIATRFGVSASLVSAIHLGKRWSWLPD